MPPTPSTTKAVARPGSFSSREKFGKTFSKDQLVAGFNGLV
jgi:hypothetical protein